MQKMAELSELIDDPNQDLEEDYIFNEYAIDDSLDPLSRLVRYHQSDFSLQRLMLVRELSDTAQYAGFVQSAKVIISLLPLFTSDAEPSVRQALVQQLYPLAKFFVEEGGEEGYEFLLNTFLPMNFELLVDKNVEVSVEALSTMLKMSELIRTEHIKKNLLSSVITLAHDERAEDYRVVAAELFNDLASKFGEQCCATIILPELELLSNDSSFSVRKAVGEKLGGICKAVNDAEAKKAVVALYLNLCKDDIWGVRQACAQSVEEIASSVSEEIRINEILPTFRTMIDDGSRWVRNRAHEYFGHLVHTLTSDDISPELLETYTEMAFQSESGDCEYSEYCAFCFPAVVEAIGRDRWNEVQDAYATMLKDVQWKVRKSLAYSLHEIAAILGTDLTEECIVPAFELLLRDLDDIKRGVVVNVSSFLKLVRPATLNRLVPLLCQVPLESENWRLRNEVAIRIGDVAMLLSPSSPAFLELIELVLRLLEDSVIKVRNSTYKPAAIILKMLVDAQQPTLGNYLTAITDLAKRSTFQGREMFVYVAQQVVEIGADVVMEKYLLSNLRSLAEDSVSNVRLVVEKVIKETFLPREFWRNHAVINEIMSIVTTRNIEDHDDVIVNGESHSTIVATTANANPTINGNVGNTTGLVMNNTASDVTIHNEVTDTNGILGSTESIKLWGEEEVDNNNNNNNNDNINNNDNNNDNNNNNNKNSMVTTSNEMNGVKHEGEENGENATEAIQHTTISSSINTTNCKSDDDHDDENEDNEDNENMFRNVPYNGQCNRNSHNNGNNRNNQNATHELHSSEELELEELEEEEESKANKAKEEIHAKNKNNISENNHEKSVNNKLYDLHDVYGNEEEENSYKIIAVNNLDGAEENEEDEMIKQALAEENNALFTTNHAILPANGKAEYILPSNGLPNGTSTKKTLEQNGCLSVEENNNIINNNSKIVHIKENFDRRETKEKN